MRYIDADVLTEARRRIRHVLATFDSSIVAFSGGKDSLVTLLLVEEAHRELGLGKPRVLFRDEELIGDAVVGFVQDHYHSGRWLMDYYAVPLQSQKFILGRVHDIVQWDPKREWIRPKPDFAIKDAPGGAVLSQYEMDAFACRELPGKAAIFTGIRADESLIRFNACVNKRNENYITAAASSGAPAAVKRAAARVRLVKPIYDWSERDVFRYLWEVGEPYCPIYDHELFNGEALRVSSALHQESAKTFDKVRTRSPVFYEQLIRLFPEMLVQERYWRDFDQHNVVARYPAGPDGIRQYIMDTVPNPHQRAVARRALEGALQRRENNLRAGRYTANYGGYPYLYLFKAVLTGATKRVIQPCKTPTKADHEYERRALREAEVPA